MAFDVDGAKKAGYSDAEIADHLAKSQSFDLAGARKAGYSDSEVISHLAARVAAPPPAPRTMLDRAAGAGEAALATVTGVASGLLGQVGGVVKNVLDPQVPAYLPPGTDPMVVKAVMDRADQNRAESAQAASALSYTPRTDAGQEYTQAVGEGLQQLVPAAPIMQALAVPGAIRSAAPARVNARAAIEGTARDVAGVAGPAAGDAAAALASGAIDASATAARAAGTAVKQTPAVTRAAYQRIKEVTGFGADEQPAMSGVGAADTSAAARRIETAEQLPVPIRLTKGEAERDFEQQRFEGETKKDPRLGKALRDRAEESNEALSKNFAAMIDREGAIAPDNAEAARILVDKTLRPMAAQSKREYKARYTQADKAGQMLDDVDLQTLAEYLNRNRAGRSSAPILNTIADELGVQEVGSGSLADGTVAAGKANLKQAEELRKSVNRFVKDSDPNDVRIASEIKEVIDGITEGKGGQLYKEARDARRRFEQLFNQNEVVSQLIKLKRGTADRQVALEDVFNKTILGGSREDLSMLRRTLDVSDQKAGFKPGTDGPGAQAWREMRGATLRDLVDEATKGVGTDTAGNPIFSAAGLDRRVKRLEVGGKLDFVLGKKGAQTVRDINEISKVVKTLPAGTVNTSNTASVIIAALAEAGATGAFTGLPVPALSTLRAISGYVADRKVAQRVNEALRESRMRKNQERSAAPTF